MSRKKAKKTNNRPDGEMSVTGHLRELRNRLLVCIGVLAVCMLAGIYFAQDMVRFLLALGDRYGYQFVYIAPQELLMEYFAVAFLGAVCVTLPVVCYEVWAFLRPGLRRNERLFFLAALASGLFCAVLGILFAFHILVPFMLHFLISLSDGSGVRAAVSVQNYVSFLLTLFIIFAAVFELPVVTVLLTRFHRKPVIVLIFFIAAVITPPDVVSQVMVAVPLLLLYELSILLCTAIGKLCGDTEEAEEAEDADEPRETAGDA